MFHAQELGYYAQGQGSLAVFKVTARDQGHYKGHSGAFVTYCNISCFFLGSDYSGFGSDYQGYSGGGPVKSGGYGGGRSAPYGGSSGGDSKELFTSFF